jgi:hypothetical protein
MAQCEKWSAQGSGILSKIAHSLMSQEFAHDLAGSFCGSTWVAKADRE